MPRVYVRETDPHRDLILSDAHGWQRGDDVRALTVAADRRLTARGIDRALKSDGELDRETFDALLTAGRLLGAREDTLKKHDAKGRRVLTVGVQDMIRYPGRRTDAQRTRAEERFEALLREREQHERAQAAAVAARGGGLSASDRSDARRIAVASMRLAYHHAYSVHYTQTSLRWQGIRRGDRFAQGEYPNYADCSSLTTWALWNALTSVAGMNFPDRVNGANWNYGYTGTQTAHGRHVAFADRQPGDLVFYGGTYSIPGHVAMVEHDVSFVYSHGSEMGPTHPYAAYRPVVQCRRYIY